MDAVGKSANILAAGMIDNEFVQLSLIHGSPLTLTICFIVLFGMDGSMNNGRRQLASAFKFPGWLIILSNTPELNGI